MNQLFRFLCAHHIMNNLSNQLNQKSFIFILLTLLSKLIRTNETIIRYKNKSIINNHEHYFLWPDTKYYSLFICLAFYRSSDSIQECKIHTEYTVTETLNQEYR